MSPLNTAFIKDYFDIGNCMVNSIYLEIMCKQLNAEAIIFYGMTWKTLLLKGK